MPAPTRDESLKALALPDSPATNLARQVIFDETVPVEQIRAHRDTAPDAEGKAAFLRELAMAMADHAVARVLTDDALEPAVKALGEGMSWLEDDLFAATMERFTRQLSLHVPSVEGGQVEVSWTLGTTPEDAATPLVHRKMRYASLATIANILAAAPEMDSHRRDVVTEELTGMAAYLRAAAANPPPSKAALHPGRR